MKSWESEYKSLSNLYEFKDNALALFALGLKFNIEDLYHVGVDSITDGADDKKIDMVYINSEEHYAVIAQCYYSIKEREKAKSNKASDLNTGILWLLQRNIEDVPSQLKSASLNLRGGLNNGDINHIYVWYVHNLPESPQVEDELKTVYSNFKNIILANYSTGKNESEITISVKEIGTNTLQMWYEHSRTPIIVSDDYLFEIPGGYELPNKNWKAYSTAIQISDIAELYKKFQTDLFSANIRDYLGSRKSESNINYGIKRTIEKEPENFWIYNNGMTILTQSFKINTNKSGKLIIKCKGLSIVNGAQTTGAVGSIEKIPDSKALVQVRFIAVSDLSNELIENIIRFNNSQNQMEVADFRSNDKIQTRLRKEFEAIPYANYAAGRRGSFEDKIKRSNKSFGSYFVGQALCAFHGDPITAYNRKREIWANNKYYCKVFNDSVTSEHIIFCCSLLNAIDQITVDLKNNSENLSEERKNVLSYLRNRGSKILLASAISSCLDTILGKQITSPFTICFGKIKSLDEANEIWVSLVKSVLSFCSKLEDGVTNGLKNINVINKCIKDFSSFVTFAVETNKDAFTEFKNRVKL